MDLQFKGTPGLLELKYVSGICIGIGTVGNYSQITANSVIDHIETDKQYKKERLEIEANMLLYSKSPLLLDGLKSSIELLEISLPSFIGASKFSVKNQIDRMKKLLKESTEIKF